MAVVGHAYVVVRAITDKVDGDIQRAFSGSRITNSAERGGRRIGNSLVRGLTSGMKDADNAFSRAANSFRALNPEADRLRKVWVNAMRAGYLLQGALGAIGGSISTLIGGLASLIGVAGGAAASLVAIGSAGITAAVGLKIATYALSGIGAAVKKATKATGGYTMSTEELREALQQLKFDQEGAELSVDRAALNLEKARNNMLRTADLAPNSLIRRDAELAFREAELAYRRAKDNQEDLKDGLKDDPKAGGSDPFADLTPSQKVFALWLISIQDKFKDLKEAAASGFLPILQQQLQRLIDSPLLGILEQRFFDIGKGAGNAVKEFVDVFLSGDNLRDFNEALGDMAEIMPTFGKIFGNLFDSLLSILVAADPLTRKFVRFLESKTKTFSNFLNTKQATGELETFFNRSGELAAKFGALFGNLFEGFGEIIASNFGPGSGGDRLLDWLVQASEGFAEVDRVFQDDFFNKTADNFMAIGDAIGGAIDSFMRLGANPDIKKFWDNLDLGSQAFDNLLNNFVMASATFGDTLRILTEIAEVFSDSGQVNAFFETINFFLRGTKDLLQAIRPIVDAVGPIFAVISAIALLGMITSKVALVFGSFFASTAGGIGSMIGLLTGQVVVTNTLTGATLGTAAAMKTLMASNPIGWAVMAIAAIAGIAVAIAGIHGAKIETATKSFTSALDTGSISLDTFKTAMRGVVGDNATSDYLDSTENIRAGIARLNEAQKSFGNTLIYSTTATTGLADTFGAVGRALANVAVTDLPKAQKGFKGLKKELGLTNSEMSTALDEMDEFKVALVDQADQLGISVKRLDGSIDKHKLLQFALGEGEYGARQFAAAQVEIQNQLKAARTELIKSNSAWEAQSLEISGWSTALSDAVTDEVFNFKDALANMEQAAADSTKLEKDMLELKMKGMSDAGIEMVKAAGAQAPALVKALIGASEEEFARFSELADRQILQQSEKFGEAKQRLIDAYADEEIEDSLFNSLYDALEKASSPEELATITALIQRELAGPYVATMEADMSGVTKALMDYKPGGITVSAAMKQGLNYGTSNAKYNGGNSSYRYADGGYITGPGGPRSDSIHAMLSNGEYVVNARATQKNRSLLERINGARGYADGGLVTAASGINITVNPSQGMNEKELAAAVSRRLAFEIRKGTI